MFDWNVFHQNFFLILGFATPHSLTGRSIVVCVSNNKSLQEKSILNSYLFNLLPFHSLCLLLFFISSRCENFSPRKRGEGWRVYSRYHTCTCSQFDFCMQSVFILTSKWNKYIWVKKGDRILNEENFCI